MDVSKPLPRFIELVLAPQERSEADAVEVQRMALESLREVRPGMLIDHIEEPPGTSDSGPIKLRPLFMRLRSHAEARTFDELRVFELGGLVRRTDPDWHENIVQLVYDARAILVDSTGLVADPASEGAGRNSSRRGAPAKPRKASRPPAVPSDAPPAFPSSLADTLDEEPAPRGAPPPISASPSPSWGGMAGQDADIRMPEAPKPEPMGRPLSAHTVQSPRAAPRQGSPTTTPRGGGRSIQRFYALCEGRLFCPVCAQPMTVQTMGHERKSYYTCASKHLHPPSDSQPEVFFPVEVIDRAVWERIADRLAEPELALEIVRDAVAKGAAGGETRKSQVRQRLERLERDELELLSLRSEDRISEGAARRRLDEIAKERRNLQDELQDDTGAVVKLRPLSKALRELAEFRKRGGQEITEASLGLRRKLVEACVPLSAEYGLLPHADGQLEIRDLLEELDFSPKLKHHAQKVGRLAGSLRERLAQAKPSLPEPKLSLPGMPAGLSKLLSRLRLRKAEASPDPSEVRDLGIALHRSVSEPDPFHAPSTPPRQTPWVLYAILLVIASLIAVLFQPVREEEVVYENLVEQMGLTGKLTRFEQVPGGWIGMTDPQWAGTTDAQVADLLCQSLLVQLELGPTESIAMMVPGGLPITECYP